MGAVMFVITWKRKGGHVQVWRDDSGRVCAARINAIISRDLGASVRLYSNGSGAELRYFVDESEESEHTR
jgi:hypothetical protein